MPSIKVTRTRDSDAEDHLTSLEEKGAMAATRRDAVHLRSLALMAGAVKAQWPTSGTELPLHAIMATNFTPKTAEA